MLFFGRPGFSGSPLMKNTDGAVAPVPPPAIGAATHGGSNYHDITPGCSGIPSHAIITQKFSATYHTFRKIMGESGGMRPLGCLPHRGRVGVILITTTKDSAPFID